MLSLGPVFCWGLLAAATQDPASFTRKPAVTRSGDTTRIEFEVSREVDVTVRVEDAAGSVVRHLAAGVLGKNPPEPLRPGSLRQSLEWDGKDDSGKPATGGPFRVRVRLGMKPEFDGF